MSEAERALALALAAYATSQGQKKAPDQLTQVSISQPGTGASNRGEDSVNVAGERALKHDLHHLAQPAGSMHGSAQD